MRVCSQRRRIITIGMPLSRGSQYRPVIVACGDPNRLMTRILHQLVWVLLLIQHAVALVQQQPRMMTPRKMRVMTLARARTTMVTRKMTQSKMRKKRLASRRRKGAKSLALFFAPIFKSFGCFHGCASKKESSPTVLYYRLGILLQLRVCACASDRDLLGRGAYFQPEFNGPPGT